MIASRLAGALSAFQLRILADHVLPVIILPLNEPFPVAYDLLGAEPAILCQRDEGDVHVRRLFVHVYHRRHKGFRLLVLLQKGERVPEILFNLLIRFVLKKLRAAGDQRLNQPHAVCSGTAASLGNLPFCLCPITVRRCNQVEIQVTSAGIHVGIACVFLFCALVVSLNPADLRPFVFGKSHDRVLCLLHVNLPYLFYIAECKSCCTYRTVYAAWPFDRTAYSTYGTLLFHP